MKWNNQEIEKIDILEDKLSTIESILTEVKLQFQHPNQSIINKINECIEIINK